MKLRLRQNSIRLRLTRGEVAEFAEKGSIDDAVEFGPDSRFCYRLRSAVDAADLSASFDEGRITIVVPEASCRRWSGTDQVGIEGELKTGGGGVLKILIEKDFACLEPRQGGEDDDTFPHPRQCGT